MTDELMPPSLMRSLDSDDDDRQATLAEQAQLPSDLVDPRDVMGDEWDRQVMLDPTGGVNAFAGFSYTWDWMMTPGQRAEALADTALRHEMASLVDDASNLAVKPPVDPAEFAGEVSARRAERARRF